MRSKHFLALLVGGSALVATAGGGCSSSSNTTSGTTGAGGSTTTTSATTQPTTTTTTGTPTTTSVGPTTTTGTGGMGGGGTGGGGVGGDLGNVDFAHAVPLMVNGMGVATTLQPVASDADYYSFMGKKGEVIAVLTNAKSGFTGAPANPFDAAYPDTVATLYDSTMTKIAEDDDPFPRGSNDASIFTVLPADGAYYIRVEECNAFAPMGCGDPKLITHFAYQVQVLDVTTKIFPSEAAESVEPNETPAQASAITFAPVPMKPGSYFSAPVHGGFQTAEVMGNDVDLFSFTIPADFKVASGRLVVTAVPFPSTPDHDGSTTPIGNLAILDDMGNTVAQIGDPLGLGQGMNFYREASPPLVKGKKYYVAVTSHGLTGSNPFYFLDVSGGGSNPVEKEPNDTFNTAQGLLNPQMNGTSVSYYVEGDIGVAGDADYFQMPIPAGQTKVLYTCGALRLGSGLTGSFALLDDKGIPIVGSALIESAAMDATFPAALPIPPTDTTTVTLKVTGAMQNATVSSTFYRCGIYFSTM